jgi:hypothetical protein
MMPKRQQRQSRLHSGPLRQLALCAVYGPIDTDKQLQINTSLLQYRIDLLGNKLRAVVGSQTDGEPSP